MVLILCFISVAHLIAWKIAFWSYGETCKVKKKTSLHAEINKFFLLPNHITVLGGEMSLLRAWSPRTEELLSLTTQVSPSLLKQSPSDQVQMQVNDIYLNQETGELWVLTDETIYV